MSCQTFPTYQMQPPTVPKAAYSVNSSTRAVFCVIWNNFVRRTAFHDVLFLVGLTIYARYRQIVHVTEHHEVLKSLIGAVNKKSLYIGLASCYGISIVANFQETNVRPMHYVGAFTAFGMGTLYFCMQSVISLRLEPYITLKKALYRSILSIICCIFFVVVAVCGVISHILFEGSDPRHWYPSDGGWRWHVASSVSEWIVATIFSFYILTFADEFRYIKFDHPEVRREDFYFDSEF